MGRCLSELGVPYQEGFREERPKGKCALLKTRGRAIVGPLAQKVPLASREGRWGPVSDQISMCIEADAVEFALLEDFEAVGGL